MENLGVPGYQQGAILTGNDLLEHAVGEHVSLLWAKAPGPRAWHGAFSKP